MVGRSSHGLSLLLASLLAAQAQACAVDQGDEANQLGGKATLSSKDKFPGSVVVKEQSGTFSATYLGKDSKGNDVFLTAAHAVDVTLRTDGPTVWKIFSEFFSAENNSERSFQVISIMYHPKRSDPMSSRVDLALFKVKAPDNGGCGRGLDELTPAIIPYNRAMTYYIREPQEIPKVFIAGRRTRTEGQDLADAMATFGISQSSVSPSLLNNQDLSVYRENSVILRQDFETAFRSGGLTPTAPFPAKNRRDVIFTPQFAYRTLFKVNDGINYARYDDLSEGTSGSGVYVEDYIGMDDTRSNILVGVNVGGFEIAGTSYVAIHQLLDIAWIRKYLPLNR